MKFIRIHARAILLATAFAAIIAVVSILVHISLKQWTAEIVNTNTTLTQVVVGQLNESGHKILDSLTRMEFFTREPRTMDDIRVMDTRLKEVSTTVLSRARGMEGGFFFSAFDEFYGYAFPTSPPPLPVYGPPPRSYNIIKAQVQETLDSNVAIARLHQFDPAIFPLATEPIVIDGATMGVVWARIHIERELPTLKLRQVINLGAVASLLGFIIALLISMVQRRKIQRIHADLEIVKTGSAHEVTEYRGSLGYIGRSINSMVDSLRKEHGRREHLERELHRKEKMASLGKLIAGVAHEVKTPLAIIKTRIQIWQQRQEDLKKTDPDALQLEVVSDDSMNLVINEIDRLSEMVRRLLFFTKPKAEQLRKTNLHDLLQHTVKFVETKGMHKDVDIIMDFDVNVPQLYIDPNPMEQVLINIIVNSIEAIRSAGTITITTRFDRADNMVKVMIDDNGIGIPEEIQQKIFDPFFTTKEKGFGLGLSICYEVIVAHGGTIQFNSKEEKGTLCTIELPMTNRNQSERSHEK